MPLESSAAEHACNTVRRQIHEEFPDISLHFVVYQDGKLAKAASSRSHEILEHPAGPALWPLVKDACKSEEPKNRFCAMGKAKEKKRLSFMAREKTLAVFFLNTSTLDNADDARQKIYALVWRALSGAQRDHDEATMAWNNMLADAFSALLIEMQGKKEFIRALARKQNADALSPIPGYRPEDYPYPIVMDAAQLVYDDLRQIGFTKGKMFEQALEMTTEISATFDKNSVLQWWAFCRPAQDMAWLNIDKNKIVGAAALTSEDPYARSTAYMVAESLNIDPAPSSDINIYNAFSDQEALERQHRKLSDDVFQNALAKLSMQENAGVLRHEAAKRNAKLIEGQLNGWCAPGLLAAANAYDAAPNETDGIEAAKAAFELFMDGINADILRKIAQVIIDLRRAGNDVTPAALAEEMIKDEEIKDFAPSLLTGAGA